MSNPRKIVFQNERIYHICNKTVDKRPLFSYLADYERAIMLINFYRSQKPPVRLSHFIQLPLGSQQEVLDKLEKSKKIVNVLTYALMPNHYHFLVQQLDEGGIVKFVSNFSNGYAKYSNVKKKRVGPVFQGRFRAVLIENDEQLIHVSRYIHLNPVTSSLITYQQLTSYRWTSFPEYISDVDSGFVSTGLISSMFGSKRKYQEFVSDHVKYARELHLISHLILE